MKLKKDTKGKFRRLNGNKLPLAAAIHLAKHMQKEIKPRKVNPIPFMELGELDAK